MREQYADVALLGQRVIEQVERVIVGKRAVLEQIMAATLAGGHVLLEDYPGLAKTASSRDIFGCSKNRQNRIVENSTYPLDDFGFR